MKHACLALAVLALLATSAAAQSESNVLLIQKSLSILGYDVGPVDGRMGRLTRVALTQYQLDQGLRPTGEADSKTWAYFLIDVSKALKTDPGRGSILDEDETPEYGGGLGFSPSGPPALYGTDDEFLGNFSTNEYDQNSTSNPYGRYGSPYSSESIANPYSQYGSRYSVDGARNPYTTGGPRIFSRDGTYLGRLNSNRYDPESVNNPYGIYGSPYSPLSTKNPYSVYGSPYSPLSPTNPYSFGLDDE